MIVKHAFYPLFNDFTNCGDIKLQKVLEFFEDSGGVHSNLVGNSISTMLQNGKTWILSDWKVKIFKKIQSKAEKCEVSTWILPQKSPFYSIREYELRFDDEVCIVATSRWVLFDILNLKIAKIDKELIGIYEAEEFTNFQNDSFKKIEIPQSFDTTKQIYIRKSDIDINDHVHNTIYLDFAYEVLPDEIFKNLNFSQIQISYKNDIKYSENIIAKYANLQNRHIVAIFDDKENLKSTIEFV